MTEQEFTNIRYWLDLLVKTIIGTVVTIVGMDYKAVKNSLHELEQKRYELSTQAQVVAVELAAMKGRLERIETKLDRVLDK